MFLCFGLDDDGQTCHEADNIKLRFEQHKAKAFHWHLNIQLGGSESEFYICPNSGRSNDEQNIQAMILK